MFETSTPERLTERAIPGFYVLQCQLAPRFDCQDPSEFLRIPASIVFLYGETCRGNGIQTNQGRAIEIRVIVSARERFSYLDFTAWARPS